MLKELDFINYQDMRQNSVYFKQGQEKYKNGEVKVDGQNYFWVKRNVSKKEWSNFYGWVGCYCPLEKNKDGMIIGFISAGGVPYDCQEITDLEEMRKIDNYRRAYNIRPFTFKDVD
jgi:hypothetical protein